MAAATRFVPNRPLRIVLVLWLTVIAAGMHAINVHLARPSVVPGAIEDAPRRLAQASGPGLLRLLMLVHPRCVCTQASLDEPEHLLQTSGRPIQVDLLIDRPAHATSDPWSIRRFTAMHPGLRRPGTRLLDDPGGTEARRLGLVASGHVLAFDSLGTLRFSGGSTALRGHAGPGDGVDSIRLWIAVLRTRRTVTPVFGRPLAASHASSSAATREGAHAVFAQRP